MPTVLIRDVLQRLYLPKSDIVILRTASQIFNLIAYMRGGEVKVTESVHVPWQR